MNDVRLTRNFTVCRRETVSFVLSFEKQLPAQWEELQLVFRGENGARLSKFVKNTGDVRVEAGHDEKSVRYSFAFTIDGTDPVGTFTLAEGAVRLRDGFIIRWNPEEGTANPFTLTVDYTPERIVALDAAVEKW